MIWKIRISNIEQGILNIEGQALSIYYFLLNIDYWNEDCRTFDYAQDEEVYSISTEGQHEHHTVTQARSAGVIKISVNRR